MNTCRRVGLSTLWVLLVSLPLGCNTLGIRGLHGDPATLDRPDKLDKAQALTPPAKYNFRLSQYVFYSDFEIKRDQPLFRELASLRDQVYGELHLPGANTIVQVYLFDDKDRYERFMQAKYPELPRRRAFFVAQPRSVGGTEDLLVYTYWGERIQEDLRHELTHALLHSVLKDVPLWLDEGLAEYYEVPPDGKGVNVHHLGYLRRGAGGQFKPDLARLEQLSQVQQMSPAEYRESWAWVHLMLRDKPEAKTVLLTYLHQLRSNPNPGLLGPKLALVFPVLDEALQRHLSQLDTSPQPTPTVQR